MEQFIVKDPINDDIIDNTFDDIVEGRITLQLKEGHSFETFCCPKRDKKWTLITAFDSVLDAIKEFKDDDYTAWFDCLAPAHYLMDRLKMSEFQIIFIALLLNSGSDRMTFEKFGELLGVSKLKVISLTEEIDELIEKFGWVTRSYSRSWSGVIEEFNLEKGVLKAIRKNIAFEPIVLTNLTEQRFFDHITRLYRELRRSDACFDDFMRTVFRIVEQNPHLPLCSKVLQIEDELNSRSLLLLTVCKRAYYGNYSSELDYDEIDDYYMSSTNEYDFENMLNALTDGTHPLMRLQLIEQHCDNGMANPREYVLTEKARNEYMSSCRNAFDNINHPNIVKHDTITPKSLFYNATEQHQVNDLYELLSVERLSKVQQRLSDKGLRRGVAILCSGAPGTGKTELVRQIAHRTGRNIYQIDISQVKSKWVGDSEKNTAAIFEGYKDACKRDAVMPILFINEADALLSRRNENAQSEVDKMGNTMQNILLEAIENLEGIMICTTNLATTLDSAFDRRFLFKVNFQKPDAEVRSHIWRSMITTISESDAQTLASRYELSGGQIENVQRKAIIQEVLHGTTPTLTLLDTLCREENALLTNNVHAVKGFNISRRA